jgi:hypothetical protein
MGAGAPALYQSKKSIDQQQETREKGGEREDTPWQSQKHVTSVSTNRVRAESRVYVMKHTTKKNPGREMREQLLP